MRIKLRDIKFINKKTCIYLSLSLIIFISSISGYLVNSQISSSALQLVPSSNTAQILQDTIFINGTDPNHDWDDYEFITGTGTLSDPYKIENLDIEINGTVNGIFITNSNKPLLIKNCIIIHQNEISDDKLTLSIGIYLQNCTNIQVKDCSINQNSYGILLSNTTKILIEESDFNNNKMVGVYSNHSLKNYFHKNNLLRNNNTGFLMEFSNENTLLDNNISENYFYGIHLKNSNDNIIQDNFIQDNGKRNVFLENSTNINYSGNIRIEQWIDGFIIEMGAVVLVTAYVIYKHSKDEKRIKKDKKSKEILESENEN